jgi:membrane-associated phospholipid phosphatase
MREIRNFDHRITLEVQKLPKGLMPLMEALSFLGEPTVVLTIGLAGYLSAAARDQSQVQRAFVYAAIAFGLSTLLKLVLRRRRPHNLDIRTLGVRSYSFPSGHAFGTVIFYGLFSYLDLKYLSHPWNILISVLLWLLIFMIGLSRIYLKTHYPSDVTGGWLLGLLSLVVIVSLAF